MSNFNKTTFNENFDTQLPIVEMFNKMGYSEVKVKTSFTNGLSHYVSLNVEVINEGKTYMGMFIYNNIASITVRISDHSSGLERNCGGVDGDRMTLRAFNHLISEGAIKTSN